MKVLYYEVSNITAVRDEHGSICLYQGKLEVSDKLPSASDLVMVMSSRKKKPSFPKSEEEMVEVIRYV